jgi:hypothetical protein
VGCFTRRKIGRGMKVTIRLHLVEWLRMVGLSSLLDSKYRVLTVVYNTQNYWIFGLCPSSGILEIRIHVLETGSASILM